MKFGTNEVFEYIKYNFENSPDEKLYNMIYDVVKADALTVLSSYNFNDADKDDIIQEVQISVSNHLAKYIRDSVDKNEEERNAWLKMIIKCKIADFFRKRYRSAEDSLEDIIADDRTHMRYLSNDDIKEKYIREAEEDELIRAIKRVCEINTSADKIIAFLLNKVIATLEMSRMNGSPKEIAAALSGKTIFEASDYMKKKLQAVISINIPPDTYEALDRKVDAAMSSEDPRKRMFTITPRIISDSGNWIISKLQEGGKDEAY